MSPLKNNNLSYLDCLNMFENMLDLLEESVTLEPTSQQKSYLIHGLRLGVNNSPLRF